MAVQTVNFWQSVKRVFAGGSTPHNNTHKVTILETDAYTLPRHTQRLQVVAGGAWISIGSEDMILAKGESLTLRSDREGVVVTAIGHKPLQLELM